MSFCSPSESRSGKPFPLSGRACGPGPPPSESRLSINQSVLGWVSKCKGVWLGYFYDRLVPYRFLAAESVVSLPIVAFFFLLYILVGNAIRLNALKSIPSIIFAWCILCFLHRSFTSTWRWSMSMLFYFCWMDFIAHFLRFLGDKSVRDMLVFPKQREKPWVFWIQIFHHLHCRFELGHVVLVQLVGRFPDLERSLVGKPPQDDRTSLGAAI